MEDDASARVDVVVVSYNSRDRLRDCVAGLVDQPGLRVLVVDNASPDRSPEAVSDLPVTLIESPVNGGFAHGCNLGWRAGSAPAVLLLNPDARIEPSAVRVLADTLDGDPRLGAVGPLILDGDGSLDLSQRRFPRLRSTYAQALFLHRLAPSARWTDELVRDPAVYDRPGRPDWISGACLMIRRSALERLGGLDDGFFLYCEDLDLCRRLRAAGMEVGYQPAARCGHEGGASAPRPALFPVLAESRVRYARKHATPLVALAERVGVGLGALTHAVVSSGGWAGRAGHLRALGRVVAGPRGRR